MPARNPGKARKKREALDYNRISAIKSSLYPVCAGFGGIAGLAGMAWPPPAADYFRRAGQKTAGYA